MVTERRGWNTDDEKEFIDRIGLHPSDPNSNISKKHASYIRSMSRKKMVETYIKVAKKRHYWGVVAKDEVVQYAKKVLEELR